MTEEFVDEVKAVFSLGESIQDDSIDPWSSQFSNVSSMKVQEDWSRGPVKTKDKDICTVKKKSTSNPRFDIMSTGEYYLTCG